MKSIICLALCFSTVLLSVDGRRRGKMVKSMLGRRTDHSGHEDARKDDSEGADEKFVTGEDFDDCSCSNRLRPVCGSDGITYKSRCIFKCYLKTTDEKITIQKKRACTSSKEQDDTDDNGSVEGLLGTNTKSLVGTSELLGAGQ